MSTPVLGLPAAASVAEAAKVMRHYGIGDVLVMKDEQAFGIVTDRDLVVRVLAQNKPPSATTLEDVCTRGFASVPIDAPIHEAAEKMRAQAVRRLPVMQEGRAVGMLSLSDLSGTGEVVGVLDALSEASPSR
ncbi:MAG: CBS domain-containing protein [Alphaproteobacteria bacterium]|nr:CBS domain-containing protein [Alphaproteobacteria bacterium]MCB9795390.1 CBS domain-containing protein [Alphaproteobacteria bacterium]